MNLDFPQLIMYGGSFDPPHLGHLACVALAQTHFPEAKIMIVPSLEAASASGLMAKHPQTEFEQRFHMCQLNFQSLAQTRMEISSIETELSTPNYTVKTLQYLKKKSPKQSLAVLIGQDQLEHFHAWKDPLHILELASLMICRREGSLQTLYKCVQTLAQKLQLKLDWKENLLSAHVHNSKNSFFLLDELIVPAASHEIRTQVTDRTRIPENWLHPEVRTYIQEQGLYQKSQT